MCALSDVWVGQSDFKEFDTNRNGTIDGDELKALVNKQLGKECTEDEFTAYMKHVDLNQDGRVDFDEYMKSMLGADWRVEAPRTQCGVQDNVVEGATPGADPEAASAVSEERAMMGPSVWALGHCFAELCAEQGCPLYETRLHGTGEYAGNRRPTVSGWALICIHGFTLI